MKQIEMSQQRGQGRVQDSHSVKSASVEEAEACRRDEAAARVPRIVYTETRVVNVLPEVFRRHRIVTGMDTGPVITAYRMLRTQVLRVMRMNGWNVLGITSPGAGEGKTVTAVNLAISLALDVNQSVLLVDLDLRRPAVHDCFGIEPGPGLSEFLEAGGELREMLFNPGIERLVVLPGGAPVLNSSELIASPRMEWLAKEMRSRYPSRLVLFDLPPLLAADDVLAFSRHLDAVLLVAEEGRTCRVDLDRSRELLRDVPVLGPVINKSQKQIRAY